MNKKEIKKVFGTMGLALLKENGFNFNSNNDLIIVGSVYNLIKVLYKTTPDCIFNSILREEV